jgi:hypothetical protein
MINNPPKSQIETIKNQNFEQKQLNKPKSKEIQNENQIHKNK